MPKKTKRKPKTASEVAMEKLMKANPGMFPGVKRRDQK